jgi:hypothetical protein
MNIRTRKLVGTLVLLIFLACYALAAMAVAVWTLPDASHLAQWLYYATAGLLWVVPAGFIITWMQRP